MALKPDITDLAGVLEPPTAYRVDWRRLALLLLPAPLRQPVLVALAQLLVRPLETLHGLFIGYLFQTRRELSYSSQVMSFERALNDRFDPLRRRIRIRNADTEYALRYWNFVSEQQPVKHYLRLRREAPPFGAPLRFWPEFSGQTDFTVIAPIFLQARGLELRARINQIKSANRRYTLLFQVL